jgi:predicted DNA-binding ribbon-helix-helix protein
MENIFWEALSEIAIAQNTSIAALIRTIDNQRLSSTSLEDFPNLSSAIRVFVLQHYQSH